MSASVLKRNLAITITATTISIVLCTLGFVTADAPVNSIAVIWPGALLHSVAAILFGGWGVVASVLAGVIVDIINVGKLHIIIGFAIPDFLQAFVPALYYRRLVARKGWGPHVFRFWPFLIYAVILSNAVGAVAGTAIVSLGNEQTGSLLFPLFRWIFANIPISLMLGYPLFRCLGPIMIEENYVVTGWWK